MGKKAKDSKKKEVVKFSKLLTPEQKRKYQDIGVPDPSQNWLEIFTPDLMQDLHTIMRCCSDNQKKCDYVTKELHAFGFEDVGLGTNIVTMANPLYPGVVFKIALDEYGIADNFNDCILEDVVPKYNHVFARDPSAMISVQERLVLMTPAQRELFMPKILDLLKELSKYFLIADLSPDMYLNYGITRDGDFRIIDGSDLYPLHQLDHEPTCKRIVGEHKKTGKFKYCEGKLKYTKDFKWLVCQKCGREYNPLELRPRKDVEKLSKILSDGLEPEQRESLEEVEIRNIRGSMTVDDDEGRAQQHVRVPFSDMDRRDGPRTIFVNPEEDDSEDEEEKQAPDTDDSVGCAEPVNACGEGEPEEESSHSDEDGESEAMQSDEDGFPVLVHKKVDIGAHPEAPATVHNEMKLAANRCIDILTRLRDSDDQELNEIFRDIIEAVQPTDNKATEEVSPDKDDSGPEEIGTRIITMVYELKASSDPKASRVLSNLYDLFGTDVSNDQNNSDIGEEESSEPHITYSVVNESDSAEDDSVIPGIYLNIVGNFDEAYDNSGLPIYITIDGGQVYSKAIYANTLKGLLEEAVEEAHAEAAEMLASHHDDSDDSEDEDEAVDDGTDPEDEGEDV